MSNQTELKPLRPYVKRNSPYKVGSPEYRRWLYENFYRQNRRWLKDYQKKKERERLKKASNIETQI